MPGQPDDGSDQLALIGPRGGLLPRTSRRPAARPAAAAAPVARVLLDSPLPRLDRVFEYLVPAALDRSVGFGVKVRVRLGRRRTEGWVIGRTEQAEHIGALQLIDSVVSPLPVLTPDTLALCRSVADHYLGTVPDVLRLAVPPRHAGAEAREPTCTTLPLRAGPVPTVLNPGPGRWIWTCPPGQDWADWYAGTLAAAAGAGGRGLAVVPDHRDVRRLAAALETLLGAGGFAVLMAQDDNARRYASFRAVLDGSVGIVIGTRSASFAPLRDPDVLLLWDDGDDSHTERRAPYPHAREVLAMRSTATSTFVVGAYGRSCNAQRWLDIGWAAAIETPRTGIRAAAPVVTATDDERGRATPGQRAARLPPAAGAVIRTALEHGPVLVCVGRTGYLPRLRCQDCGTPADCRTCGGALVITSGHAVPTCSRCGLLAGRWQCPECGSNRLRSVAVGSTRTGEELGRAFPGVPVVVSSGTRVVESIAPGPALVVATPGAEPHAPGGYAAVVVLDVAAALALPGLRSGEQAARRWFNAGAMAQPGAPMVVVADPALPVVQALLRWDPGWFAARELAQREQAGMPPARRAVSISGDRQALDEVRATIGRDVSVLGPVPDGDRERILLTVAHRQAARLISDLRSLIVRRSAEGESTVAVTVDPQVL